MTLSVGVDIPGASFSGSAILVAAGTQRSFLSLLAELSIVSLDLRGHSRAEDREDAKSHGLCGAGGLSMYMRIKLTNALGEEEFNLTFEEGAQLLADQPTQGLALLKEGARLEVLLDDSSTWALVSIKTVEQKLVWGLPFPKTTVPLGTLEIGLRVFAEPDWSEVSLPHLRLAFERSHGATTEVPNPYGSA